MRERILTLLGSGLSPAIVSSSVGCSPSFVSQLMAEDGFALEVATLRAKDIEKLQARDGKWDDLEDQLLARLKDLIPFMMKPREVLQALTVVNGAKRRAAELLAPSAASQVTNNYQTVVLQLPTKTINAFSRETNFELSKNNEVISVAGRALVPMATSRLLEEVRSSSRSESSTASEEKENDKSLSDSSLSESLNLSPEIAERINSVERV